MPISFEFSKNATISQPSPILFLWAVPIGYFFNNLIKIFTEPFFIHKDNSSFPLNFG